MSVRFSREPGRLHVLTGKVEWTILKRFTGNRGPCYISDVRTADRQLVNDPVVPQTDVIALSGHTINDPRQGGLFGFGVVAAKPPPDVDWSAYDPRGPEFWKWGWEITTRLDGRGGWGVIKPRVAQTGPYRANASCELAVAGRSFLALNWAYLFTENPASVRCVLSVMSTWTGAGLWLKEPKVVANGLRGWRTLVVSAEDGRVITTSRRDGPTVDLTRYRDPRRHTKQIPQVDRYKYDLAAPGRGRFVLTNDGGLAEWAARRNELPPMRMEATPGYCLDAATGRMNARTEIPRWDVFDLLGVVQHVDEGGFGAPDCLRCFRPAEELGVRDHCVLTATFQP